MSKYFKLYRFAVIFPLAVLLLSFANNRTSQSNNNVFNTPHATVAKLHYFIGKREYFENLPPPTKLIFSHTFDALGPAGLSAWVLNENDNFEYKIELENGGPSGTDNKPGLVFGNVVLKPGQLAKIQRELRRNKDASYVIFRPVIVDSYFIGYNIGISENKAVGVDFVEFAEANPSPPKVY